MDEHTSNVTLPTTTPTGTFYTYSIPGMDIGSGTYLFTLISNFLGVITPTELPLQHVRQLLYSNLTIYEFASNSIKAESGFLAIMSIFIIMAMVPLIATCCWCCCRGSPEDDFELGGSSTALMIDDSLEDSLQCRKSASLTTLWIVFILLGLSDLGIYYANSHLSTSIEMAPQMIQSTVHDMEVFLKDTHLQIRHKLDNGFHISVEKVIKDLEDVDVLLGEPIQAEVSAHTGLELAFDSLATISLANAELIYRVLMLQETVGRALKISQEAAARMEELQIQLSVLQRQCTYRDRPLCDTLRIRSFEENGIIDALKTLQEDQTIFRMRYLGEIEFGATVKNLTSEVGMSRSVFGNFPQQVNKDTAYERNYTLTQLENIRHRTTANAQMLTVTINALLSRLKNVWDNIQPHYLKLQDWSNIYWTIGWVVAVAIVWILLFLLMSYCCFLCEANIKAGIVLFIAVVIIILSSFCITVYGLLSLAIGGNAEIFLCQPLYDRTGGGGTNNNNIQPYDILGKLFDKPGYAYENEPKAGIIGELLRPDGVERAIVNVSLSTAIRGCERNEASYNVFQLDAFVNTTAISNLKQFPKVTEAIDEIEVSGRTLLSLTQTIQNILENMIQMSTFNLTNYRNSIGAPTPEKDLATFIDQMQRVALQIQDVATSSRMTTLGSRSKRLQASILQPLEQLQNEILYHLTALELQKDPWAKQVNQTLNHLKNIQDYLETHLEEICNNQTRIYTDRLKTYLNNDKATMSSQLGDTTAKCRPFFDIFDANRMFFCRNMVDFVNAIWFLIFLTLLLWSIATPVGLNMISIQRSMNGLRKAKIRIAERGGDRGRRRDRGRGSASPRRDRSTSSGTRPKPQLRRSATEETLDIADEYASTQVEQRQQRSRSQDRESDMGRDRDRSSKPRETPYQTAKPRSRPTLQRQGTDEIDLDDNWGSSETSRGASYEREREHVGRGRERERESQAKYTSNTQQRTQNKPQLRRQGTEDILLDDDFEDTTVQSSNKRGRSEPRRDVVERERESQAKYSSNAQQKSQNKPQNKQLRRQGTEDILLDDDFGDNTTQMSNKRGRSEPRRDAVERERESQARAISKSVQQQKFQAKPQLRRRGTEDMLLDDDEDENTATQSNMRGRSEPRRGDSQTRTRRSVTPVLSSRPDARPAEPMPRTPSRLRSHVSLTTRQIENIVKKRNNRIAEAEQKKGLQRKGTQEFDLDEETIYSNSRYNSEAVQAARRTPPRSAPPPPPPPSNRFGGGRSVRWTAGEEDLVFEDCD